MFCNFLRHKDTQNILFLLSRTILPWSHRAATFPTYGKNCSLLIHKCSKPQTKRTQKYAKVRKNQLKKICTCCFEHGHNSTQFLFWWVYQPKLLMHITRNTGDKQRLILYSRLGDKSMIRLGLEITCMSQCINHCYLCDAMIWHDMTFFKPKFSGMTWCGKACSILVWNVSFCGERSKRPKRAIVQTYKY